jgi:uncharacterized caspase-like protein
MNTLPKLRTLSHFLIIVIAVWLTGCATAGRNAYSDQDKQAYPKVSSDADTVIALISDRDNTRFMVDGKSVGYPVQAGGELKILVNNQFHDIIAQAEGYRQKPQHIQPPYDEHSPISFGFTYKDKIGAESVMVAEAQTTYPTATPTIESPPLASSPNELPVPGNTSGFGNYFALIIGNERYQHTTVLKTPIDDADSIKNLLVERYSFDVTVVRDASREKIYSAFAELQNKINSNSNVLIFYAGHGHYKEDEDRGYWLPVDADPDNQSNWIANDDITSQVKAMTAKHVLVVADSCYSGSITRAASGFRSFGVAGKTPESAAETSKYLAKMSAKKARKVMTSGGVEPVVDAGGKGNHSVFAAAFASVLQDSDGVLEGTLLFNRIREKVANNADQTPEYGVIHKAGDDGGDFLFIPRK